MTRDSRWLPARQRTATVREVNLRLATLDEPELSDPEFVLTLSSERASRHGWAVTATSIGLAVLSTIIAGAAIVLTVHEPYPSVVGPMILFLIIAAALALFLRLAYVAMIDAALSEATRAVVASRVGARTVRSPSRRGHDHAHRRRRWWWARNDRD